MILINNNYRLFEMAPRPFMHLVLTLVYLRAKLKDSLKKIVGHILLRFLIFKFYSVNNQRMLFVRLDTLTKSILTKRMHGLG